MLIRNYNVNYKNLLEDIPKLDFYFDEPLNHKLSYRSRTEKDKPVLLLLHGFNGNSKSWAYQFKYFQNKRSIIAIDFPGFGGSDYADIDMTSIAKLLRRFLLNIKIILDNQTKGKSDEETYIARTLYEKVTNL